MKTKVTHAENQKETVSISKTHNEERLGEFDTLAEHIEGKTYC